MWPLLGTPNREERGGRGLHVARRRPGSLRPSALAWRVAQSYGLPNGGTRVTQPHAVPRSLLPRCLHLRPWELQDLARQPSPTPAEPGPAWVEKWQCPCVVSPGTDRDAALSGHWPILGRAVPSQTAGGPRGGPVSRGSTGLHPRAVSNQNGH